VTGDNVSAGSKNPADILSFAKFLGALWQFVGRAHPDALAGIERHAPEFLAGLEPVLS